MRFAVLCFLLAALVAIVHGHGRLIDPPSRNSMWRYGFQNPYNYNDMELFCGGYRRQWDYNEGRCGICGDAYDVPQPRPHEIGGLYGNGGLVRHYKEGDAISVLVELTANHRGFFIFKMCSVEREGVEVTQECLDQNIVPMADSGKPRYYVPTDKSGRFKVRLQLPSEFSCKHCVIQWTYTAGNNWARCPNGKGGFECGPQETFRNCADISILPEAEQLFNTPATEAPKSWTQQIDSHHQAPAHQGWPQYGSNSDSHHHHAHHHHSSDIPASIDVPFSHYGATSFPANFNRWPTGPWTLIGTQLQTRNITTTEAPKHQYSPSWNSVSQNGDFLSPNKVYEYPKKNLITLLSVTRQTRPPPGGKESYDYNRKSSTANQPVYVTGNNYQKVETTTKAPSYWNSKNRIQFGNSWNRTFSKNRPAYNRIDSPKAQWAASSTIQPQILQWGKSCRAIGVWSRMTGMHSWCDRSCRHSPPFCPPTHCQCSGS